MDNLALSQGGNFALAAAGLAEGTNANTIQIAATTPFVIDGRFYSKAITDNIAISYTAPAVYSQNSTESVGGFTGGANGSTRLYCIFLDTAGAVTIMPGPIVDTAKLAAGEAALHYPATQRGKCCIGAMRIAVTVGVTYIPGTTDLGAANVTDTFENLSMIPGEPLRA